MKVEMSALFRGSLTDLALNRATRRVSAGVDFGRKDRGMEFRLSKSVPARRSVTQRSKSGGGTAAV